MCFVGPPPWLPSLPVPRPGVLDGVPDEVVAALHARQHAHRVEWVQRHRGQQGAKAGHGEGLRRSVRDTYYLHCAIPVDPEIAVPLFSKELSIYLSSSKG